MPTAVKARARAASVRLPDGGHEEFGAGVPTAVLSGVYKLRNLQDAQRMGLALSWAHDLKAMIQWIKRTRRR